MENKGKAVGNINYMMMLTLMCTQCLQRQEEGVRIPGAGKSSYEPPHGCWDLNSGPFQDQKLLLTAEPSLCPLNYCHLKT